jgi:tetratricopeptide (TPR) repeat protein
MSAPALLALAVSVSAADKKVEDAVAKAEAQIVKGLTDEAERTGEKLVKQQPTAEAWAARARIQLRLGNVEGAAASAAEGARLAASSSPEMKADALATVALLDLERGTGKDAMAHAQEAVAVASNATTLAVLARAQARVGNAAAVATARKAVEAGAQSAAAHEALGQALLAAGSHGDAVASFREALAIEPKRASARAGLANALVLAGKASEAVTEARKATEDNPHSGEAFAMLATAIYAAAPNKDTGWKEAINEAASAAFMNPRNTVVQVAVGHLFEAGGNIAQAEGAYRKALDADPGYAPAHVALLESESRKDLAGSIARLRQIALQQPASALVQFAYGKLLARQGAWAQAIEPLEKAAPAMPTVAELHALLGTAYQRSGRTEEALGSYTRALQLAPSRQDYRSTYGLLLGLNDQHDEGIAELKKVTADPSYRDAAAWVNLGWLYRDVQPKRINESAAAYERALQIDPKNAPATLGVAWVYAMDKRYDQAIASFGKAIDLDKTTAGEAYNGIGWSYLFENDLDRAASAAEKAKEAGRNVTSLLDNIEKRRRAPVVAPPPDPGLIDPGPDVASLCQQLQHGSPRARAAAARRLARGGSPAADCLVYAFRNDAEISVQQAAANSLAALGAAAGREACVQLRAIGFGSNPYGGHVTATPQEMQKEVEYNDLQKAARGALARIGCN